jgi:RNA polymerase sigma factor (sigma-70 family)
MHGSPKPCLVHEYMWIVEKFEAQYRAAAPGADLRAAGVLGLVEAAARFEPTRGLRFSTYAWTWVKGAVLAELRRSHVVPVAEWTARKDKRQGRPPRVMVVYGALDEDAPESASFEPAEQEGDADREMRLRGVRDASERLEDPSHRLVIAGTLGGRTPEQIGESMGLGDERVRQLLREAQTLLAESMWDDTWEDERMDDDELSASDIALIQDPSFYRTAQPLVRRLAVAVLEARAEEEEEEPVAELVAANEQVLAAHEKTWELEKIVAAEKKSNAALRDRVQTLEATLRTERDRLKLARSASFDRTHAAEVRALLRQAMKALKA